LFVFAVLDTHLWAIGVGAVNKVIPIVVDPILADLIEILPTLWTRVVF